MSEKDKPWCFIDVHPGLQVKIDEEDRERVARHKWRATKGTTGRQRVVTSVREPGKGVKTLDAWQVPDGSAEGQTGLSPGVSTTVWITVSTI